MTPLLNRPRARNLTRWTTAVAVLAASGTLLTSGVILPRTPGAPGVSLGAPVDVHAVKPPGTATLLAGHGDDGRGWRSGPAQWPAAGKVRLTPGTTETRAGGLPVSLKASGTPREVTVEVLDQQASRAAGYDGVLVRLEGGGDVGLTVDYGAFAQSYGGGWASRLQLAALSDCASPAVCRTRTPVPHRNDSGSRKVSATVAASGLYALSAGSSSGAGDYKATSLAPAGAWSAGNNAGNFGYSYGLRTPPAAGPAPALSFAYSSQSHDGRTSGSNNQASMIGDGWSYEPGYIERRYAACAEDQDGGNNAVKTGDRCWDGASPSITMSLNGTNTNLVRDDTTGEWRTAQDASWRVRLLGSPASVSAATSERWMITTTDGTQYTFGATAESRWTVPVFGNNSGEPCHATAFRDSRCTQAYRWLVEKVADVHGNQMTFTYATETGHYGAGGDPDKRVSYERGGWLTRIDYGLRSGDATVTPTGRVEFTAADRCLSDCGTASAPRTANWPDTPWDLECRQAPCSDQTSPAFFSTKRLAKVTTKVASGTGFRDVDSWTLTHEFKNYGDDSQAVLWLKSIQHTGLLDGNIALPPTVFAGQAMPNRVETGTGIPAVWRWRITAITSETGGVTAVSYSAPDCAAGNLPSSETINTRRCYPVWWTPEEYWEAKKDWFHNYVVTSVVEQDTTAATAATTTRYTYSTAGGGTTALWGWDDGEYTVKKHRTYSQWRGYSQVTTQVGDPAQGQPLTTRIRYYRGLDGERLPGGAKRSVAVTDSEGRTAADHRALAGKVLETAQLDSANGETVDSASVQHYWTRRTAERDHDGGKLEAWQSGVSELTTRRRLTATAWQRTRALTTYDNQAREVMVSDLGDVADPADDQCTRTEYAHNIIAWIVAPVARTETVSVACDVTPQRPRDLVGDVRIYYDGLQVPGQAGNRGLPTQVDTAGSWNGGPVMVTEKKTGYDPLGRPLWIKDGANGEITTGYTPAGAGPVTKTVVTNKLGHTSTTAIEPGWGLPTSTVDQNGRRADLTYDALGRLTAEWGPGQSKVAGAPALQKFGYQTSSTAPTAVTTQKLTPAGGYATSVTLYDSRLRKIQSQADTPIGGRLVTEIGYDHRGQVAYTSGPNFDDGSRPSGTFVRVTPGADHSRTIVSYDGLGRTTSEAFWSKNVHRWGTTYAYGGSPDGLMTLTTPPLGAVPTAVLTSARGKEIERRQYQGSAFTATRYAYTPRGEIAAVTDPAGNRWEYEYDLRGNQIRISDPDTGTSTAEYDAARQRTASTDSRGRRISVVHDVLGRVASRWEGAPETGTPLAKYEYDTVAGGLGMPAKSSSYVDGQLAVTERIAKYDAAGRPTQHYTDIAAVPGLEKLAGSYLSTSVYAANGQVTQTGTLGYGGLAPEGIAYGYNSVGQPVRMVGTDKNTGAQQVYVDSASFTTHGELAQRALGGTGGGMVYQTLTYEDGTRRRATALLSTATGRIADLSYTYDDAGNVTSIGDGGNGSPGAGERQCLRYDGLRRLNEAWTQPGTGDCAAQPATDLVGGPAPYWSTYTHDVLGNRTSETKRSPGGTARTHTYAYSGTGHLLSSVTVDGAANQYKHIAGNLTERTVAGQTGKLTWDALGKLATVTRPDGRSTRMVYNADGNRVARIDANGDATVFAAQSEITYTASTGAVTAVRSYSHLGEAIAVRSSAEGLIWLAGDHHGTGQWTITAGTMSVTTRRQDPYGNPRGAAVAWNAGQKGFVGGVDDPTGFVHIGARSYDPSLGRFISRDPVTNHADPQQVNGYTYADANPATFSDPTGMFTQKESAASSSKGCTPIKGVNNGCIGAWLPQDVFYPVSMNTVTRTVRINEYYVQLVFYEYVLRNGRGEVRKEYWFAYARVVDKVPTMGPPPGGEPKPKWEDKSFGCESWGCEVAENVYNWAGENVSGGISALVSTLGAVACLVTSPIGCLIWTASTMAFGTVVQVLETGDVDLGLLARDAMFAWGGFKIAKFMAGGARAKAGWSTKSPFAEGFSGYAEGLAGDPAWGTAATTLIGGEMQNAQDHWGTGPVLLASSLVPAPTPSFKSSFRSTLRCLISITGGCPG
ncbi:RHS repeat-associated core domain-containing protein [Longispora albida]|uniref:RHS repeat-associated core domain-containing protein n=1 Tax=Longispora albida TaxID=203523 RepID=UPI0003A00495|nr:RHS repeat-associated core domain-containing protein [Longispora albida]